jgi:hypothetical protein
MYDVIVTQFVFRTSLFVRSETCRILSILTTNQIFDKMLNFTTKSIFCSEVFQRSSTNETHWRRSSNRVFFQTFKCIFWNRQLPSRNCLSVLSATYRGCCLGIGCLWSEYIIVYYCDCSPFHYGSWKKMRYLIKLSETNFFVFFSYMYSWSVEGFCICVSTRC